MTTEAVQSTEGAQESPSYDQSLAARLSQMHAIEEPQADNVPQEPQGRDKQDGEPAHPQDAKPEAPAPEDATPPEPTYKLKLKVDGREEDREYKHADLVAQIQKAQAVEKRFGEAAEARKAAEAEASAARTERGHLAQALQHYTQQLAASQPQQPDAALLNSDPVAYLQQRHAFDQWMQAAQQAQTAQAHLQMQEQQARQVEMQQRLTREGERLLQAIPEWADADKAKTGKAQVRDSLKAFGFSEAEVGALSDSRMVLVAHKAAQYDAMRAELDALKATQKAAQQSLQAKLQSLPPVRTERPGSAESNAADGRTRAMQRLSRSGSIADAASVIRGLI